MSLSIFTKLSLFINTMHNKTFISSLLSSLLTCNNWESHNLYFGGIGDIYTNSDSMIFQDKMYSLSYEFIKEHECYENISFTLVNNELVGYPSYDLKSELEKACSNNRRVLLWNFHQKCKDKCDFRQIKIGEYESKVCQGSHCFKANGTIDQPFKLDSKGSIKINNTIYPCKIMPICDRYSDSYVYVKCSPWWFSLLVVLVISALSILLLSFIVFSVYILFLKVKIRSEVINNNKNYRVKMINNKALIIPNSVSHNHTKRKTKRNFFLTICILINLLTLVSGKCDNSLDMISYQENCIVNSTCTFSSHSIMMYSSIGETKCFIDKMGNVYSVRLDKVSYTSPKLISYYVPDYVISTETDWRCSRAGDCKDGVFQHALNDSFYIDFKRTKTAFDGCFYNEDECKRVKIIVKTKGTDVCTVLQHVKLEPKLHLTITKNKAIISDVLELYKTVKVDNITIKLQSYDLDSLTHSIIDCNDYYIKRDSNLRNEYGSSKYGLIQCESKEAALNFDKNKCKTDVSSLLVIIGDSVKIRENDLHTNPLNFANKYKKGTEIKDLLDIKDNFLYVLEMKANNTKLDSLLDLTIKAIEDVRVNGMMGLFETSFIQYKCDESAGLIYISCASFFSTIISCRSIGINYQKVTINQGIYPSSMYCSYQYEFGEIEKIMVIFNVSTAEIVIYDSKFTDDNHFTENETLLDKFSLKSLFMSYVQEHIYIIAPLVIVVFIMLSFKMVNMMK
ncbi:glycoprotein [Fitzroy Crossing tenui-like virus 1]|uniref:Glycoprotein n=1 Tax=Fitzroy Crossing tenui-like virus 1 TaxID=2755159 RepID=A0A7D5Y3X3_9VIRU|nr:glycoprotein [Fitzroy Crossing tenui-like virus 1]QLJ83470.1 glycoprotein [Fitzroy Crossing tenui-like virus 1]